MATEQEKQYFGKSFTLQCRIMHPNLLTPASGKPDAMGNVKPAQFSTMAVWPKTSNAAVMAEITQFINTAFQTFHQGSNPAALVNPIKDYDTYVRQDGKPNADYCIGSFWANLSSGAKFAPVVVDQMRQPVISEAEVYSGRNAVVNITFYNMTGGQDGRGRRGIGANIAAVMLLEGGERLVGGPTVDVNQVFGNFQADMGMIGAQPTSQPSQAPAQQYQQPQQAPAQQYQQPQQTPAQQFAPQQAPVQQPVQPQYAPQAPVQQPAQQGWTPQPQAPAQEQPQQPNNPFAPAQEQPQQPNNPFAQPLV